MEFNNTPLLAIIFFAIGCILILHFCLLFIKSIKTNYWKLVKGELLNIKMDYIDNGINEFDPLYKANIKYQYTINDNTYTSKRIFYGDFVRTGSSLPAKKIIKKYSVSDGVSVYYNPANPKESVLEKGVHGIIFIQLLIGVIFIIVSVYLNNYNAFP